MNVDIRKPGVLRRAGPTLLASLLAALVFGTLQFYLLALSPGEYTADSFDSLLWAEATLDSGTLLNKDFYYPCHLPTGGNLLLLPFVAAFGMSLRAQVWGMWTFSMLFCGAVFCLLRQLDCGWRKSCVIWALLTCVLSLSTSLRALIWGHILYYNLGLFYSFLGLGLLFGITRRLEAADAVGVRQSLMLAPVFVWFLLAAMNRMEILVLCNLPVLAALAGERFLCYREEDALQSDPRKRRFYVGLLLTVAAATAVGYFVGGLLEADLQLQSGQYAVGHFNFAPSRAWAENLSDLLENWMLLLGYTASDAPMSSPAGLWNLVVLGGGMLLAVAPVVAAALYRRIASRPFRCLILFHWCLTALLLIGWVFGGLNGASWRLTPLVATSALVTLRLGCWVAEQGRFRRQALLLLVPMLLLSGRALAALTTLPVNAAHDGPAAVAIQNLEMQDLTYGYATFWNATPVTVLSDSRIKVRNIRLINDFTDYEPYKYQANAQWFEDQPGQERYFVLLTRNEYEQAQQAGNPLIANAAESLSCKPYYMLLIYGGNIF